MKDRDNIKTVNGYNIASLGGFVTVKHWNILKDGEYLGCAFKFKEAKQACESGNFDKIYKGNLY